MTLEAISEQLSMSEGKRQTSSVIVLQKESLPAFQFRSEIIETIEKNSVTLIKGETGCGKSTQVVTFCVMTNVFF